MQALLESETQRANESEKKYAEALETIETMKLEKTERMVQLQEYACFSLSHYKSLLYVYTVEQNYCKVVRDVWW